MVLIGRRGISLQRSVGGKPALRWGLDRSFAANRGSRITSLSHDSPVEFSRPLIAH